jgi:hypothetical protein
MIKNRKRKTVPSGISISIICSHCKTGMTMLGCAQIKNADS